MNKRVLSFLLSITMVVCFMPTVAWADGHSHEIDGAPIEFAGFTETTTLPAAVGNYYLTDNVTLSSTWTVPVGEDGTCVNLCLNGHSILISGSSDTEVIKIPSGAALNVYDCVSPSGIIGSKVAAYDGRVITVDGGTLNLYGGTISGGNNNYGGGGVYVKNNGSQLGVFNMFGGKISDNKATNGAAVYISGAVGCCFNMFGGKISDNKATNGAAVYISGADVCFNMLGGTIENNNSTVGAVYVCSEAKLNLSGGAISRNTSSSYGAGVYNAGTVEMKSGTISGNTSDTFGAGLFNGTGTVYMLGGTISGNTATENGGGVYNNAGTFTLSGGAIRENNAKSDGGGVYNKSTFTMYDGEISSNSAIGNGGGVYSNPAYFNISGGAIKNNVAKFGGGVYARLNMSSGTIENNRATENGGGVYAAEMNASGGKIINNFADSTGGGIVCDGSGEINLGGNLEVSGNKVNGQENNISGKPSGEDTTFYIVSFSGADVPEQVVFSDNPRITKPTDPAKSRHTFGGWHIDSKCTTPWAFDTDAVTQSMTLYAKWIADNNGGDNSKHSKHKSEPEAAPVVEPTVTPVCFGDVPEGAYYKDAVNWAVENGITTGTDETHFSPFAITTRAQMITFLWRAAGCPEPGNITCSFADVKRDSYYEKAVLWGIEKGITKGASETAFGSDMAVTRAQTVTFLARYAGINDEPNGYASGFTDVTANDYFMNAVAWANEMGITSGMGGGIFAPKDGCQRGQVVTFLYRLFN